MPAGSQPPTDAAAIENGVYVPLTSEFVVDGYAVVNGKNVL